MKDLPPRFLFALDFDNTLIAHSPLTRICVEPLFPDGALPEDLIRTLDDQGWDSFLRATYKELYLLGVTKDEIVQELRKQELIEGMREAIVWAKESGGDVIIISDSFTVNVEQVLIAQGLDKHVDKIFTNASVLRDDGEMVFPDQDKENNNAEPCKISGRRVCKGKVLQAYVESRAEDDGVLYEFVGYAGDGGNDLCAALALNPKVDVALPRTAYPLARLLKEREKNRVPRKLAVTEWTSGWDVKRALEERRTGESKDEEE